MRIACTKAKLYYTVKAVFGHFIFVLVLYLCRFSIFMCCFVVVQRENGVGDGSTLMYLPVVVDLICHIYPEDIKDYAPKSKKVGKMDHDRNNSKRVPFTLYACI